MPPAPIPGGRGPEGYQHRPLCHRPPSYVPGSADRVSGNSDSPGLLVGSSHLRPEYSHHRMENQSRGATAIAGPALLPGILPEETIPPAAAYLVAFDDIEGIFLMQIGIENPIANQDRWSRPS